MKAAANLEEEPAIMDEVDCDQTDASFTTATEGSIKSTLTKRKKAKRRASPQASPLKGKPVKASRKMSAAASEVKDKDTDAESDLTDIDTR